jgi:hypothetical protein
MLTKVGKVWKLKGHHSNDAVVIRAKPRSNTASGLTNQDLSTVATCELEQTHMPKI